MKTFFLSAILTLLMLNNNNPRSYVFSTQIEENFISDPTSFAYFKSSWEYASIGEYQKSLWSFDQVFQGYPKLNEEDKEAFLALKPINGRQYILDRAENEKIIMINEAHHQPLHRTFTTSLLKDLYERGYRFLGLEAMVHTDSLLNERGFPVLSTGYYTQEPQFGNMVREALKLGYTIFPYETKIHADGKEREIQQARNIQQVVEKHPDDKFLIHCGFDHIIETYVPGWEKAMAGRVKEFTGIDPFTINQEILTEHFLREKENPYFLLVDTLKEVSVFVDDEGNVFHGGPGDERFDVRLFHPRTTYINGRPNWLLMQGERKIYMLHPDSISIDYPILVKAFNKNEGTEPVPVDVIEIKNITDQKGIILPTGEYNLLLKNFKGDSLNIDMKINDSGL
jgi:hypothetical protein